MTQNALPVSLIAAAMIGSLHAEPTVTSGQGSGSASCGAAMVPKPDVVAAMKKFIDAREISGVVTLVADGQNILHLSADGFADLETKQPMKCDSVFWIASMTKPITATAVMMLQDEGKLSVDDPVSKYLPEFTGDKAGITIKQCLTHTSGLSEASGGKTKDITTLKELVPLFTAMPLVFPPGSRWSYCQSGINTVARVVEVVAGKTFPGFLQERLFDPLGMKDTSFYPTEAQFARLASSYKRTDDGNLEKAEITFLGGKSIADKERYPRANGGLFSTAEDYAKFSQMILNGGQSGGTRYLKAETVEQMTSLQSGKLVTGFTPGNGWGLGWCVIREPQGVTAALSSGTFGHGGLFGTQAWIDPVKKRIYLLLVQRANFTNQGGSDGSDLRREFLNAAAQ